MIVKYISVVHMKCLNIVTGIVYFAVQRTEDETMSAKMLFKVS